MLRPSAVLDDRVASRDVFPNYGRSQTVLGGPVSRGWVPRIEAREREVDALQGEVCLDFFGSEDAIG